MKKLIIYEAPELKKNLEAMAAACNVFKLFIATLINFQEKTSIDLIDLKRTITAEEFLRKCIEVIPSRCELTGRSYFRQTDFNHDIIKFTTWAKNIIADQGLKFNGLPLNREALLELIELPEPETTELIKLFREAYSFYPSSRIRQYPSDFLQFISIVNEEVKQDPEAEERLTAIFTVYANETQMNAWEALEKAVKSIQEADLEIQSIQKRFGLQLPAKKLLDDFQETVNPELLLSIK